MLLNSIYPNNQCIYLGSTPLRVERFEIGGV